MGISNDAANGAAASGSRSRPQARKKPNDEAAYLGPPSTGAKRQANDRAEGEPRVKRKRIESSSTRKAGHVAGVNDDKSSVDFNKLPARTLHRYLSHFDLIPLIYPSPLMADRPPAPSILLDPTPQSSRGLSPLATPTPGIRPRRDPKDQSRRRSSRLPEENESRTPILADIAEVHTILASIADKHFQQEHTVDEIDTLASFMVKTKNSLYPSSHV
ncbi:hypothetical protein SCLCIDRAFT_14920 [Scleroderma citrinum Foug A]|uniref:Histone deacetylase complex subunit SAP30 Sin3 binding domain-containing protein n=1 Tax=Scleroderma citrinum Foug A TaxID=1036808 RepID=A0A0C2ZUN3_9AGAM|nr:hypothetical protein SCLCIDRAFT_14920 [Scleroderma citrinum Foug A]